MRTSITGKLTKSACARAYYGKTGFTLVELMVVIALIGIILVLAVPTTRNALTGDGIKKASRQLIGLERKLRVEAVRDQADYILCLDLPTSSYWIVTADMTAEKENEVKKSARKLSAGARILDIVFPDNKKFSEGEVRIRFGKNSICPPMVIHLGDEEERMTIVVNPFMGVTGIYDEYKDISLEEGMGSERIRL
ncbi:MAG: prepilin-type N-terminal cleavage/methylation domain-containing protein [Syntrophaceae bacterium]|nr:prepilin-type N-terminal cleavage/methylation domain-containing protein [Syntrophaceae bacterium]